MAAILTDRELLELAAKAAGIDAQWYTEDSADYDAEHEGIWLNGKRTSDNNKCWNPLTNDGDALRLAVKLDLPFRRAFNGTFETGNDKSGRPIWEIREPDPYAAARRAIVRAAAEIGRNMS